MPIQFRCVHCQSLLQVPDDSAGERATCQSCGAAMTIPVATTATQPIAAEVLPGEANPYQSPADTQLPWQPGAGDGEAAIQTTRISAAEVFALAAAIYGKHLGKLLLVELVMACTFFVWNILPGLLIAFVAIRVRDVWAMLLMISLLWLSSLLVLAGLALGQMDVTLRLARGQPIELLGVFAAFRRLPAYIGATLLFSLMTTLGYLLCFLPGVIVVATFGLYPLAIVDRGLGPLQALAFSRQITQGNRLNLLAMMIFVAAGLFTIMTIGSIAGTHRGDGLALAIGGVGTLFFWPYAVLVLAVGYLRMCGQPVAISLASDIEPVEPA